VWPMAVTDGLVLALDFGAQLRDKPHGRSSNYVVGRIRGNKYGLQLSTLVYTDRVSCHIYGLTYNGYAWVWQTDQQATLEFNRRDIVVSVLRAVLGARLE